MVPLSQEDRDQMLSQVTDLVTTDAANTYWLPPTTYLLSPGEYRTGAAHATRSTPTGATACARTRTSRAACPSAPG